MKRISRFVKRDETISPRRLMIAAYISERFHFAAIAKFAFDGANIDVIAFAAVLNDLKALDQARREILVEVQPHAARRCSNSQAASTNGLSIRNSAATSSIDSPPRKSVRIVSVARLVPSMTERPNAC